jgi:hypothetical protein
MWASDPNCKFQRKKDENIFNDSVEDESLRQSVGAKILRESGFKGLAKEGRPDICLV